MLVEIIMPQMGESITEATIIKWHKKVGDFVRKDEIIYEITTDKVDTEIPSPCDGTLIEIKVPENETAKVGTVVALIESIENQDSVITSSDDEKNVKLQHDENMQLVDLIMPKMGESLTSGTIIKWHKSVGDYVKKDEIIVEISTDKVDTEIPSPAEGIIKEILYKENETVEAGTVIAKILITVQEKYISEIKTNFENKFNAKENIQSENLNYEKNRFYSPAVLNIARMENISLEELNEIKGTGIKGRVTKKDVLDYIEKRKTDSAPFIKDISQQKTNENFQKKQTEIIEINHLRQKIIDNMIRSRDTSVHVTSVIEVDVTRVHDFINKYKDAYLKEGIKLTYLPFISYAAIKALKEFPLMNSAIEGSKIVIKKYINLGIAVAIEPDGLVVPNIKNADNMNIAGLAKAISDISQRARSKKLTIEDVTDGTFTITNFGIFGTLIGTPIINQPEIAVLGVGNVTKKPVVIEKEDIDSIAIRSMVFLSLSHDHRLIDGMLAGKFLMFVKNYLENFDEYHL